LRLLDEYKQKFLTPFRAADLGYIDSIIDPISTRRVLCQAFSGLTKKRDRLPPKKHGNIPL
jgi:acetyl-CoA carboxylase carboxyltransferase component